MVRYIQIVIVGALLSFGAFLDYYENSNMPKKGIYYDHVEFSDNVDYHGVNGSNLDYSAELNEVGDSYYLSFDIVNDTDVDMRIMDVVVPKDDSYIHYALTYDNGEAISFGNVIPKGNAKRVRYQVFYKNRVLEEDYLFDSSFHIQYEQVL